MDKTTKILASWIRTGEGQSHPNPLILQSCGMYWIDLPNRQIAVIEDGERIQFAPVPTDARRDRKPVTFEAEITIPEGTTPTIPDPDLFGGATA